MLLLPLFHELILLSFFWLLEKFSDLLLACGLLLSIHKFIIQVACNRILILSSNPSC